MLFALLAAPALAEFRETATFKSESLVVENLVGEIRILGGEGPDFEVEVAVQGRDASPETVRVEKQEGAQGRLTVRFPLDRETRYVYPKLGRGASSTFQLGSGEDGGWLKALFSGKAQVKVSGSGSGLEVWADATVKVPRGKSLRLDHGVGGVTITGVDARIAAGVRSGAVEASAVKGDLSIDTGSGHVSVEGASGQLSVDTGSGHVSVRDVTGPVRIDTGSGHVTLSRIDGAAIDVDTGSGHVEADGIRTDRLAIDTGSGGVEVRGARLGGASIDPGSGGVELGLEEMGPGRYDIETGSGGITLDLPAGASAHVDAETGSGGIQVGLEGIRVARQERNEMEFTLGDGAAQISLETGSGGIRIGRAAAGGATPAEAPEPDSRP
jgi:hypothetical protein